MIFFFFLQKLLLSVWVSLEISNGPGRAEPANQRPAARHRLVNGMARAMSRVGLRAPGMSGPFGPPSMWADPYGPPGTTGLAR